MYIIRKIVYLCTCTWVHPCFCEISKMLAETSALYFCKWKFVYCPGWGEDGIIWRERTLRILNLNVRMSCSRKPWHLWTFSRHVNFLTSLFSRFTGITVLQAHITAGSINIEALYVSGRKTWIVLVKYTYIQCLLHRHSFTSRWLVIHVRVYKYKETGGWAGFWVILLAAVYDRQQEKVITHPVSLSSNCQC